MIKFDRHTRRRFLLIAKPFFVSEVRWKAWSMLFLLVCFSMSVIGLNVLMSYVGRDFMTALSLRQKEEFFKSLWWYLGAFLLATPFVVFYRYTEERLGLMWRRWLSHHIMRRYFSKRAYYRLAWHGGIDNPDQRIAEDVRAFTAQTLSFSLIIFNSLIQLISFTRILYSISVALTIVVILYAVFGSLVAYFLGRPLMGLNFAQLQKEADYRYKLINVRDNAESIAFTRGEGQEFTRARQRLKAALKNLLLIVNWNRNLNFFTTGYNYILTILPTVVVAPLYLEGKIEFGAVTQATIAFGVVLNALSVVVNNFGLLSSYVAEVTRLGSFLEVLDDLHAGDGESKIEHRDGPQVEFKDVTIVTPRRDQTLLSDLNFSLQGKSMLICGPSGSGKSSVLRAIAGLWNSGCGLVVRPPVEQCCFLPQRPYMVIGSLRAQLLYGVKKRGLLDRELMEALERVQLDSMLKRVGGLEARLDWPNVLATGEQQRLAFARMLLSKPRFAFLDEATTAVDPRTEVLLHELLRESVESFVSVGHRASLARFHELILQLRGDGTAQLEDGAEV